MCLLCNGGWNGTDTRPEIVEHHPGRPFPDNVDIVVGGGGQDSGQLAIQTDLLDIADQLRELADNGTPMLVICGLYQLLWTFFQKRATEKRSVVSVYLKLETHGGKNA